MNGQKLRHVCDRLDVLDDRLTHKVRPRQPVSMGRLNPDLMAERVKHLSEFTVELKEIVRELAESLAPARSN